MAAALGTSERAAEVRLRAALDALRATLGDGLAAGDALEARLRRAGTALAPPAPSAVARILAVAVAAERRGARADVRALATRPAGHADWTELPAASRRRPLPRGVRRAGLVVAGAALLAGAGAAVLRRDARPHARPRAVARAAPASPTAAVALAVVTPVAPTAVPLVLHGARPLEAFITHDVVALLGRGAPLASATFSGPASARSVVVAPSRPTPFAAVAAAAATSAIARRLRALGERIAAPASSGAVTDAALLTRRPLAANRVDELAAGIAAAPGRSACRSAPSRPTRSASSGSRRSRRTPSGSASRAAAGSRSLLGDGAPVLVDFELRAPDGTPMAQAVRRPGRDVALRLPRRRRPCPTPRRRPTRPGRRACASTS